MEIQELINDIKDCIKYQRQCIDCAEDTEMYWYHQGKIETYGKVLVKLRRLSEES